MFSDFLLCSSITHGCSFRGDCRSLKTKLVMELRLATLGGEMGLHNQPPRFRSGERQEIMPRDLSWSDQVEGY